jgi:hypothetical protein
MTARATHVSRVKAEMTIEEALAFPVVAGETESRYVVVDHCIPLATVRKMAIYAIPL